MTFIYLECHSSTRVFQKKPTTWFTRKWNIGWKRVKKACKKVNWLSKKQRQCKLKKKIQHLRRSYHWQWINNTNESIFQLTCTCYKLTIERLEKICSKLTIKTPERRHWLSGFTIFGENLKNQGNVLENQSSFYTFQLVDTMAMFGS